MDRDPIARTKLGECVAVAIDEMGDEMATAIEAMNGDLEHHGNDLGTFKPFIAGNGFQRDERIEIAEQIQLRPFRTRLGTPGSGRSQQDGPCKTVEQGACEPIESAGR